MSNGQACGLGPRELPMQTGKPWQCLGYCSWIREKCVWDHLRRNRELLRVVWVHGCNIRVHESCFRVHECSFRVSKCSFRVNGCCFRVHECNIWVHESCFRVRESSFRVSECCFRVGECCFRVHECCFRVRRFDIWDHESAGGVHQRPIWVHEGRVSDRPPARRARASADSPRRPPARSRSALVGAGLPRDLHRSPAGRRLAGAPSCGRGFMPRLPAAPVSAP